MNSHVNYLAVIVAATAAMATGYFWYAPGMFRESWLRIIGKDTLDKAALEQMKKESRSHPTFMFIATFISSAVLARLLDWLGVSSLGTGILVGFWAWLGFALPVTVADTLFSGRERDHMWRLFLIRSSHQFFALLIMGGILGAWK